MSEDAKTPAEDGTTEPLSPAEEQKRKFRAALEAKQHGHHGAGGAAGPIHQAHTSPAVNKRVHRRKSG